MIWATELSTRLVLVAFVLLFTGCGVDSKGPSGSMAVENAAALRASPYAVDLKVTINDETDANILYIVNRDGFLSWGGGMDALVDKTTWSGAMSEDERQGLFELLVQYQWFTRDPASTNDPEKRRTSVDVRGKPGSNHFRIRGANDDVQPVVDYLAKISRRRLEPQLQALPQPGLQKQ